MQLDEIVDWIDGVFGEVAPAPEQADVATLRDVFGDPGYQRYFQDQVEVLKPLKPQPGEHPHIKLVPN